MALTPVSRLALESALTEPSANTEIKTILDTADDQANTAGTVAASKAVVYGSDSSIKATGVLNTNVIVQSGTAAEDLTSTASDLVWVASTAQAGDIKLPQATAANTGMVIKVIAGADWSGTAFNLGFSNAGSTVLIGMLNVAANNAKDSVETFPVTSNAKVLVMDSDDVTGAGGAKGSQYTFTYLAANLVHVEAHGKITTGTVAPDADATLTTGWS